MAAELLQHDENAPCALFDDSPGRVPRAFRVLTNFFAGKRKNMTLGFPTDLNKVELSEAFLARLPARSPRSRSPTRSSKTARCSKTSSTATTSTSRKFPTPVWHDQDDGGRYIGTGIVQRHRDPDESWINVGTYRVMIHDKNAVGFYISPGKHGRIHRDKY